MERKNVYVNLDGDNTEDVMLHYLHMITDSKQERILGVNSIKKTITTDSNVYCFINKNECEEVTL